MHRRDFVAGSLGASMMPLMGEASAAGGGAAEGPPSSARPQVLELRRYQFRFGPMAARHAEYAKRALLPALNRAGIKPVGAFTVSLGPDSPALYMLLPHATADSVVALAGRLGADAEYHRAAASFRALPATDPPYVRRDSWLMTAFAGVPAVELPSGAAAGPTRVFELRTYQSHNEAAGLKKIEMFDRAGELPIFRRLGIAPVFFGRNIVGTGLPSLTYMTVFPDVAARDKAWAAFGEDPEWVKLRSTAGFSNADILTNIHIQLLRPADYSQI
jgi:hypothetical protein